MRTPETSYLFIPALAASIVLAVGTPSPPQREQSLGSGRLAQYCVPAEENSNGKEIYC
jgi:hypothetical protein